MKSEWKWSVELEAKRVIYVARNIATGFYEKNGFVVVPPEYLIKDSDVVVFPNIGVKKVKNFWDRVKKINISNWSIFEDKELLKEVINLLNGYIEREPKVEEIKIQWKRAEKQVIKEIERILNKPLSLRSISIYPSYFGPSVSYNVPKNYYTDIELFLRFDQSIQTITEGILSSLMHNDLLFELQGTFRDKEFVIDWLVKESSISKILQKYKTRLIYKPTTEIISNKQRSELHTISENFLTDLGHHKSLVNNFTLRKGLLLFEARPILDLNWQEKRLMQLFVEKQGELISFDAIGQLIFKDENDYSLWALAKYIQRLRGKLEQNGISGSYIQTVRKRGYVLR